MFDCKPCFIVMIFPCSRNLSARTKRDAQSHSETQKGTGSYPVQWERRERGLGGTLVLLPGALGCCLSCTGIDSSSSADLRVMVGVQRQAGACPFALWAVAAGCHAGRVQSFLQAELDGTGSSHHPWRLFHLNEKSAACNLSCLSSNGWLSCCPTSSKPSVTAPLSAPCGAATPCQLQRVTWEMSQ